MSLADREPFLKRVSKCGIFTEAAFEKWLKSVSDEADAKQLARDLIRSKHATVWQAKMLLKGANRLKLGNYILTEREDKSDYGDRFAAVHPQLSRNVTIQYWSAKICASADTKKKIFDFGSKLAELDHPNLIHVYDIDVERDRIYVVSESVEGTRLTQTRESPLTCKAVAKIVTGCLRGLSYAHEYGVVHGGMTDETVILDGNGDARIVGLNRFAVRNVISDSQAAASR